jgi:hypothetical protein
VDVRLPDVVRARAETLGATGSEWLVGLDATAIEEWALLERVLTGLLALDVGLETFARPLLRSAEVSCASGG